MKGWMRGSKHWRGTVMEVERWPKSDGSDVPLHVCIVVEVGSHREGGYGVNGGWICVEATTIPEMRGGAGGRAARLLAGAALRIWAELRRRQGCGRRLRQLAGGGIRRGSGPATGGRSGAAAR
ncbi:hypothetical protein ZWY2020_018048 [Hordeum vulgare]|nr:hypothetical protein ZWY2020_018048 [Hordeum vulgare]